MSFSSINTSNPVTPINSNSPLGSNTPTPPLNNNSIKSDGQKVNGQVRIVNKWSDKNKGFDRDAYPLNGREISIRIVRKRGELETNFFILKQQNEEGDTSSEVRVNTFVHSFNLLCEPSDQLNLTVLVDDKETTVISGNKTLFSSRIELIPYSKEGNNLGINVSFNFSN